MHQHVGFAGRRRRQIVDDKRVADVKRFEHVLVGSVAHVDLAVLELLGKLRIVSAQRHDGADLVLLQRCPVARRVQRANVQSVAHAVGHAGRAGAANSFKFNKMLCARRSKLPASVARAHVKNWMPCTIQQMHQHFVESRIKALRSVATAKKANE